MHTVRFLMHLSREGVNEFQENHTFRERVVEEGVAGSAFTVHLPREGVHEIRYSSDYDKKLRKRVQ